MEMLLKRGKSKNILVKRLEKLNFQFVTENRKLINKTDALQRPTDQPANKGQIKLICRGTPEQIEAE